MSSGPKRRVLRSQKLQKQQVIENPQIVQCFPKAQDVFCDGEFVQQLQPSILATSSLKQQPTVINKQETGSLDIDYLQIKQKLGFQIKEQIAPEVIKRESSHPSKLTFVGRPFIKAPAKTKIVKKIYECPPQDRTAGKCQWPPKRSETRMFKRQMKESRRLP